MNSTASAAERSTNDQLRDIVAAAGLSQPAALARFNEDLFRPYSLSSWQAYFCAPGTVRYRRVPEDVLERAKTVLKPRRKKA